MMKRKSWYKLIYRYTIRLLLDIVSFHYMRKKVSNYLMIKKVSDQLNLMIDKDSVVILQIQFFDRSGKHCYNGGGERYAQDLAKLLMDRGKKAVLLQLGFKEFWKRQVNDLLVIGIPVKNYQQYFGVIGCLRNYQLAIYSGMVNWGKKLLHPNIMISHGITWDQPTSDAEPKKIYNIIKDVDEIVSVDVNTISWLRSTFAVSLGRRKMAYIPNYVDTKQYKPVITENKNIKILFPRRCAPERGYWLISKILPDIMGKYKNIEFDFVGFAHGEEIIADIRKLADMFPNRVNHYVVNPDEMFKVYQQADISLIPTIYSEGTSLSCLEAMACGNAVIATNIGGLSNLIIDRYNGLLINPDEFELKSALDKLLSDEELRNRLSGNAVKVAEVFDKSVWQENWNRIFIRYESRSHEDN